MHCQYLNVNLLFGDLKVFGENGLIALGRDWFHRIRYLSNDDLYDHMNLQLTILFSKTSAISISIELVIIYKSNMI